MLIATRKKAGLYSDPDEILYVLSAEAWRSPCIAQGMWRENGSGLCEWDSTLRYLDDPASLFNNTPYKPLIGHPETYSGADPKGPLTLAAVSEEFRARGDKENTLVQLRNAMAVAIQAMGRYPKELALAAAEVCDIIEKDSLAAMISRASVLIDREDL
jgi:hypothetical protein